MRWFRYALLVLIPVGLILWAFQLSSPAPETQPKVTLPELSGPVLLTVSGLDSALHPEGKLELDLGRLNAIGPIEIETTTIWTEGVRRFRGVPLQSLVDLMDIAPFSLRLTALNDYAVDLPPGESSDTAPILAFEMDGAPMSVREKGPIWLIYPYDQDVKFRTDTIYSRSIWQLDRIEILR